MRQTQRSEQRHTNMSEAKMRIARNISHSILLIAVLLSIASCATKGAHNAGYKWIEAVGLKDQKYITACGPEAKYPVAPDVRAGSKMSKAKRFYHETFIDIPTDRFWYEGTHGVVMQRMWAEPRAALCPAGSKVVMRRPDPAQDRKFNQAFSPPGLEFAGPYSTAIKGVPLKPGRYTTNVVLCGRCERSDPRNEYPFVFTIDWVVEGRAPRRVD